MGDNADSSERTERRRIRTLDKTFDLLRLALYLGFAGFAVHEASMAIQAFAGKTTDADLVIGFITGGNGITITISATLSLGLLTWGLSERRLRRRLIKQFSERPKELELRLDPNRSSSGLTPDGRTPPNHH